MGTAESKSQHSPPETPQYLKYSHLREIQDPRSPGDLPRTPILTVDDKARLIDPRSPTLVVPRTPIYCIPVPDEEEYATEFSSSEMLLKGRSEEAEDDKKNTDDTNPEILGQEATSCSKSFVSGATSEVESSPEKNQNVVGLSDKGYLLKKNKVNKKRQRRGRNKKIYKDENCAFIQSQQNFKGVQKNQSKRLPLAPRMALQITQNESPSLDMLIKNAKRLSLNSEANSLCFASVRGVNLGKENLAATFTP